MMTILTKRARTRRPTDAEYAKFLRGIRGDMELPSRRLARGEISIREWAELVHQLILEGHTESWVFGRQRAGYFHDTTGIDALVGRARADAQAPFLLNFMEDLVGDRYRDADGVIDPLKMRNRMSQYAHAMRGTATDAFINASDAEMEFTWELGGTEAHCSDCPRFAEMSPWYRDTLFVWPGSMDTPCRGHCKCHLVREDGNTSFKPVTL